MKRAILLAGWWEHSGLPLLREYSVAPVPARMTARPYPSSPVPRLLRGCAELISVPSLRRVIRVKGSQHALKGVVARELVEKWGGRVERIAHVRGWSSTGLMTSVRRRKR
jgi:hypothetical protein